ncbi:E3 ubiquitin-ligase RNF185 isoform X1 [Haematococcus lacustris]|uniref:RING-type E3 ubiquitin transferase n=1 Tax=Haematococcus lacustris TaxID=44745 RepID=A0A699Z783_HAELA|nr:E3 ubiquitin-ligase RNF185 isoform X1 [Haematococcus lacustris]
MEGHTVPMPPHLAQEPQSLASSRTPDGLGEQARHSNEMPVSGQDEGVGVFECNICLELASEPVVTLCGHLYCWPCLFRWMQLQSYAKQCPVCKAGVDDDTVIPIYGRGNENPTPAYLSDDKLSSPAPARPAGQRPAPVLLQVHRKVPNLARPILAVLPFPLFNTHTSFHTRSLEVMRTLWVGLRRTIAFCRLRFDCRRLRPFEPYRPLRSRVH